jgi:hypothetical protein
MYHTIILIIALCGASYTIGILHGARRQRRIGDRA